MRTMLILAAALPMLAGCYHTTVVPLSENQRRVTFVDDSPTPLGWTSPVLAEQVTLWSASDACPTGFKVAHEALDLGSYPHTYSIDVQCRPTVVVAKP